MVERCLRRAALWDEVKDRLNSLGSLLSGGQQQRLTIARALSQDPEVLLLDEFSIAVDPVTTMRIEDVLKELRHEMTIVLVTNLVQQARRLADRTAFFLTGELVEIGETERLFDGDVKDERTRGYLEGKFGLTEIPAEETAVAWSISTKPTPTPRGFAVPSVERPGVLDGWTGRYAIETEALSLWYGDFQALFDVDLQIKEGIITSLIGPSGCGKSTLLRTCNRIIERLGYVRTTGSVRILGHDVFAPGVELVQVRKQVGMVFQRPNPLPISHPRQRAVRLPTARSPYAFRFQSGRRRSRRVGPPSGPSLGQGQGPSRQRRHGPLSRRAAEALQSPGSCR